ncbi:hypothetical protein AVEN_157305-1 [Araneus ventricosus]|uniref:Uncharacterized protein n=1 Tax=Araneus ventricosus TaxID=182803 RepID=A0A4Y2UH92_ARAVE|nr:hypothetical protein AVEN_157305-1 [Araneus ventricosus]
MTGLIDYIHFSKKLQRCSTAKGILENVLILSKWYKPKAEFMWDHHAMEVKAVNFMEEIILKTIVRSPYKDSNEMDIMHLKKSIDNDSPNTPRSKKVCACFAHDILVKRALSKFV